VAGDAAVVQREVAVLLFELFPWFYLVFGFTVLDAAVGVALFVANLEAGGTEKEL
jgi:hypothetical protein